MCTWHDKNIQSGYVSSFLVYKTLREIVSLFFSNVFQSSFSDGKFIPSHIYSFIKGSIFVILSACFLISLWFNATVTAYWKHLSFLLIGFIIYCLFVFFWNQENLIMIHHNSNLFYVIYNTINEHNQGQTHYLLLILSYFDIYFWVNQKVLNFISFIINHDFYIFTFWMHYMLFIIVEVICYC